MDEVIAFYAEDGKRYFKVGHKIDDSKPLDDGNVVWKLDKKGRPLKFDEYDDAAGYCYGKGWKKRRIYK